MNTVATSRISRFCFRLRFAIGCWPPEDHLALCRSDAIDALDLSSFEARYGDAGPGNPAYDPRMMLKALVDAYRTGTISSRKIAVDPVEKSPARGRLLTESRSAAHISRGVRT